VRHHACAERVALAGVVFEFPEIGVREFFHGVIC
jgi:hypothetical protein